jgi:hypothetical protein
MKQIELLMESNESPDRWLETHGPIAQVGDDTTSLCEGRGCPWDAAVPKGWYRGGNDHGKLWA